jgi:hypothetical protein
MKQKHIIYLFAVLVAGIVSFSSCKKKFTEPTHVTMAIDSVTTIQKLRSMYANQNIRFSSNTILRAVITMDETSGNIYKQIYIRDNSGSALTGGYGAMSLHFLNSSNGYLSTGDSIAINLNGVTLDLSAGGSLQLDSIRPTSSILKIKTGLNPAPLIVSLPQLNTVVSGLYVFDGHLVQINNVEFVTPNVGQPYAIGQNPPAAPISYNRYINDFTGNTMVTYNSGYANFAYTATSPILIPNNSGTVTAIASLYNTVQLTLRSYPEINLSNSYSPVVYDTITQNFTCAALASKSVVMLAGWKNVNTKSTIQWQGLQYGFPPIYKYSPSVSDYRSVDSLNEIWFISPPIIDHGGGLKKYMDFTTALQYGTGTTKRCLSVLVSGTYDGSGNPDQFSWTDLSTSLYTHIQTTSINGYPSFRYASNNGFSPPPTLTGFVPPPNSGTFYVAFKFRSNTNHADSTGMTYLINNFILRNNP